MLLHREENSPFYACKILGFKVGFLKLLHRADIYKQKSAHLYRRQQMRSQLPYLCFVWGEKEIH